MKLTAVQVSIPQVTRSTMSIPKRKDYFNAICLLLHWLGSQPHPAEHSDFCFAQEHFIREG